MHGVPDLFFVHSYSLLTNLRKTMEIIIAKLFVNVNCTRILAYSTPEIYTARYLTPADSSRTLTKSKTFDPEQRKRTQAMTIHETIEEQRQREQQPCFLCALDPHPCAVSQLEGVIIAAHEAQIEGEMVPWVTLKVGETYASITLTRSYRELVKGLRALEGPLARHKLTLRVYHLPSANNTTVHGERSVDRYRANVYTLAILEPSTMLNITDLNQAEYCARQYLLGRMAPSAPSTAALRGNLVHACFKELLKEQDRGRYARGSVRNEEPLAILHHHLDRELVQARIDLALLNTSAEAMRAEIAPHLESLANWFNKQRNTLWDWASENDNELESDEEIQSGNLVRAETFLLAPEVGLRGRLDLLWQQNGRRRLLELKTGGASGSLPRSAHKWQVQGYHALLTVRRESRMKKALATLLYSGTPQEAQNFGIPFTIRQLQQVNATRNLLVLSHVTGVPPAPPGVSRCTKCALQDQCVQVSALLGWQPPELERSEQESKEKPAPQVALFAVPRVQANGNAVASRHIQTYERSSSVNSARSDVQTQPAHAVSASAYSAKDRDFFAQYYHLLQQEGYEVERQQAMLWQMPVEERVTLGAAINHLIPLGAPEPTSQGEWHQTFRCVNTSELRAGDEILLSDGDPVTGEVVTGTILDVSAERVSVWTPELIAHPTLLDRYGTSIVHVRTVQNLLRWLQADTHMRGLVSGALRPRFNAQQVAPRADFNDEQNLAVARALQMRDYLLVHGPPGTGKTSVIAEIVKRLCQRGQRVLLAGFTNQAVDNMLLRLEREGIHDYIRLGHERSVDEAVLPHLLQNVSYPQASNGGAPLTSVEIRELMRRSPVVASTTATWSSDKYIPAPRDARPGSDDTLWQFDVALIDEAGQLTIPAILGALRFARRFILVGDEKQLPPLVLNKEANEQGLGESLFSQLKQLDGEAMQVGEQAVSACVPLRVQYRMHETISNFASRQFYRDQLHPHVSVARRRLNLLTPLLGGQSERGAILQALSVERPMVFLNVRGERSAMPETEVKLSNAEARAVRETIAGLLARGVHEDEIGVIAPYRAQVANLRRHLFSDDLDSGWTALPSDTPLSIDTVDRFQGGERSIIIISFATTTTPPIESQLREHLTNPNRLNVALTRAQRKLILVGNAAALDGLPIFHQLLAYCRELHALFSL
jgi:DNA replication ATP-dependent helicase Dna2